ncbi:ribonuclease H-like domain-containing protein [Wukongibacter baidiensis]|uniref:ribonuclease H-like domain-containing protein n=1 Tax=Wukongibacter baidiensis TaxID=1723361 RepID=UPI003D7F537F
MDIIENTMKNSFLIPNILSETLAHKRFVLFDIETTGLSSNYNKVILIGILYIENGNIIIKQFFCNNSSEELELLEAFIDSFQSFDFYITFNGGNFDVPFLNKRFAKHNLNYRIDPYLNFDLYKVVRKNKDMLGLNNCKLKTIEKYLGIDREDTIDGGESVRLFKKYEHTGDEDLKRKILLHNYEDILHLLPTLNILSFIDRNKVFAYMPKEFLLDKGLKMRVVDYKTNKDFLSVSGNFYGLLKQDFVSYNRGYDFIFLKDTNEFRLKIPLLNVNTQNGQLYSFINLNELHYTKSTLSEMSNKERLKYLVKVDNEIKDHNIYNFIEEFSLLILKEVYMSQGL